jgi:hypothetical protein
LPTTPNWSGAANGPRGDLNATNLAAQGSQQLGTHNITPIYGGLVLYQAGGDPGSGTNAGNAFSWVTPDTIGATRPVLADRDVDQPFTMPSGKTAIGRLRVAVRPQGAGAGLQVSVCANDAGNPGVVLGTTILSREEINQLAAPSGISNGGPLAGARSNVLQSGPYTIAPWSTITTDALEFLTTSASATYGNFMWFIGGANFTSGTLAKVVYGVTLDADGPSLATAQPSLPVATALGGAAASSTAVVYVGGGSGASPALTGHVFTASFDPLTGTLGAWGQQPQLPNLQSFPNTPATAQNCAVAIYDDRYVYVVGGYGATNASGGQGTLNSVYTATVSNAQITQWSYAGTTPTPIAMPYLAIVGDYLLMMGGFTDLAGNTVTSAVYYAKIDPDTGALGFWKPGPRLPVACAAGDTNQAVVTDTGVFLVGGLNSFNPATNIPVMQSLTFYNGEPGEWQQQRLQGSSGFNLPGSSISSDDGTYTMVVFDQPNSSQQNSITSTLHTVPYLSVPMWVNGLTGGGTYHLKLHQIGGGASDYLELGQLVIDDASWLYADRYTGGSWSSVGGQSIAFAVYDQTVGINPPHLWEDPVNGQPASVTAYVRDRDGVIQGMSTTTLQLNAGMNVNPTFTSGTSPWVATGGAITQSSAQTHGGLPFSGLLTPSGVAAQSYVSSEVIPIDFTKWYTVNGWFYTPTGHSMSLSVNWFDSTGAYLATSSSTVTPTASTWTQVTNVFQPPAGAASASIVPTESGTPAAGDLLYLSNVTLTPADPPFVSSVVQVNYDPTINIPTGTTLL